MVGALTGYGLDRLICLMISPHYGVISLLGSLTVQNCFFSWKPHGFEEFQYLFLVFDSFSCSGKEAPFLVDVAKSWRVNVDVDPLTFTESEGSDSGVWVSLLC